MIANAYMSILDRAVYENCWTRQLLGKGDSLGSVTSSLFFNSGVLIFIKGLVYNVPPPSYRIPPRTPSTQLG